jgi:hypothetical protein
LRETEKNKTLLRVLSLLKESHEEYKNYMHHGKKFVYTKKIRSVNQNVYDLLKEYDVPDIPELALVIEEVIEHLEQWIPLWDNEKNNLAPNDDDIFVFGGYKRYPKNFEEIATSYLKENQYH